MKKITTSIKALQYNNESRYIQKLILGASVFILILTALSIILITNHSAKIKTINSGIIQTQEQTSARLYHLMTYINESSLLLKTHNDKQSLHRLLKLQKSSKESINSINTEHIFLPDILTKIQSIKNSLNVIDNIFSNLIIAEPASLLEEATVQTLKTQYSNIQTEKSLILKTIRNESSSANKLLNKYLDQLIAFSLTSIILALIIGFFIALKILTTMIHLINEIHENKKQSEISNIISEQKSKELARASQVLVKTNKNLSNSLEKLNATQDQLVQNEKMASLGDLVAGIAHEINTPIGIGVTAASHLQDCIKTFKNKFESGELKKSEMSEFITTSHEAGDILLQNLERAAKLIQSFKQVAVDQSSEDIRHFNLKEYLQGIIISLRPKLKKTNINIQLNCSESLELTSYPGAFSQIITNFIINSLIHAFDDESRGKITISVLETDNSIQLIYCDDGKGVAEEHLPSLFEPFFTTRRGHGGSGLGLHLVYNIVTQLLHGDITANNNETQGIHFIINIPNSETV